MRGGVPHGGPASAPSNHNGCSNCHSQAAIVSAPGRGSAASHQAAAPWTIPTAIAKGKTLDSSPAIVGGIAYFESVEDDTFLYAVDARTGQQRWRYKIDGLHGATPAVAGGTAYVVAGSGVVAIDATTGKRRWRFEADDLARVAGPAVAVGAVYVTTKNGDIVALDAQTGKQRWRGKVHEDTGRLGQAYPAAVAGTTVYVTGGDSSLYALAASDGHPLWHFAPLDASVRTAPVITPDAVYVGGPGSIWALAPADGAELWRFSLSELGVPADAGSAPAVTDFLRWFSPGPPGAG